MAAPVVHFEIHAGSPERALEFYHTVFGWAHTTVPGMEDYWLLYPSGAVPKDPMEASRGDRGIAGGMTLRRGPPPAKDAPVHGYVCVLEIEDVDSSYEKVKAHGGSIALEPMDVEGVGRVFYAKDPEGNIFGAMQPAQR